MAFELKAQESVRKGVRRLLRQQIDKALDGLNQAPAPNDEVIHDARKCFKKVRALLRLVRDELGEKVYQRENYCFRDAGRPLTEVRDAKVLIETLDKLCKHYAAELTSGAFDPVRQRLQAHQQSDRERVLEREKALDNVRLAVGEARARLEDWPLRQKGWAALEPGLRRCYQQGHKAQAAAVAEPIVETLHEWRKQAKYLYHQLQVLAPLWPAVLGEVSEQVHRLTQLLGDDHDLSVLRATVTAAPEAFGGSILQGLFALMDRRHEELQCAAFPLGLRVYCDRPAAFTRRMHGYWKAWRDEATTPVNA
jgi:CHAD domain-containing protein